MYDSDCTAILGGTVCGSLAVTGFGPLIALALIAFVLIALGVRFTHNRA